MKTGSSDVRIDGAPPLYGFVLPGFSRSEIELPLPPTLEVLSVTYIDGTRTEQQLAEGEDFRIIPGGWEGHMLVPALGWMWPATANEPDAVRIRFRAGYELSAGKSTIPEQIRQIIGLTVNTWFAQRQLHQCSPAAPRQRCFMVIRAKRVSLHSGSKCHRDIMFLHIPIRFRRT